MNILFVVPYPLSKIRARGLGFVSQLRQEHKITILSLCSNRRELAEVHSLQEQGFTVLAIYDTMFQKIIRIIQACGTQIPFQVAYGASQQLRKAICEQLTSHHFDIVHIESIRALGAFPETISTPIIWDAIDCISQLYDYGSKHQITPLLRFIGKSEARRLQIYEAQQLQRFHHILITSERDRQALITLAKTHASSSEIQLEVSKLAQIIVLPHGIDQSYIQPFSEQRGPDTLIFSGKMSFHANIAAVQLLIDRIMPIIWQQRPQVRLIIAGSSPGARIRKLARDARIEVTGYVPDLRSYISQSQIAVCPLPYAVGIQNKVLEAMASGTPVVATSYAAGGIDAKLGTELLVADQPEDFAQAVIGLLTNHEQWSTLSKNGLDYIQKNHNWEAITPRLLSIYKQTQQFYIK